MNIATRKSWALGILLPLISLNALASPVQIQQQEDDNATAAVVASVNNSGSPVLGATGYKFVNGVIWDGPHMAYCPPTIGSMAPSQVINAKMNFTVDGKCEGEAMVSAQEYIDIVVGAGKAIVIGVAPAVGRYGAFGIIYYRATAQ